MARIIGNPLHNIPWEPKPAACAEPIWRSTANPIIRRDAIPGSNSVFNSAVAPFGDKFAGVFRCDTRAVHMNIFSGFSDDGYNWKIDHEPIAPVPAPGMDEGVTALEYRYDPRVVLMEGRYYVSWCNGYHGPTIGLAYTDDFRTYYQIENAFLPFNRNGVLFPRRINNKYMMLSRPSDNGHTPFGDIFLSESPDLIHWGRHRHVMGTRSVSWESTKIGAGPVPIETDEGWLLIYHGVLTSCNGYVYRMGVALLDIDEPWKVIYRAKDYLFTPAELYEQVGEVPNVVFPCAALTDAETGRIAIYYGCADTVTGLAFTTTDGLIDFAREHS